MLQVRQKNRRCRPPYQFAEIDPYLNNTFCRHHQFANKFSWKLFPWNRTPTIPAAAETGRARKGRRSCYCRWDTFGRHESTWSAVTPPQQSAPLVVIGQDGGAGPTDSAPTSAHWPEWGEQWRRSRRWAQQGLHRLWRTFGTGRGNIKYKQRNKIKKRIGKIKKIVYLRRRRTIATPPAETWMHHFCKKIYTLGGREN